MKVLIQQAQIADPNSPHHGSIRDILIESGIITDIQPKIEGNADQVIEGQGLFVSPGWMDLFANFADPGYEFKETLESGAAAAAAGGFTAVLVIPNTRPVIDSKSMVEYIRSKSARLSVDIYPIGALSRQAEGKDLAEMYDMASAGALAFGDGLQPVQSAGLLLKALQYVRAINGVIIQIPDDKTVGANGQMHEGIVSTRLGLPGKPIMAEELLIARDIKLARYTGSRLHFTGVTSPKSLEYIRRAKSSGLDVTCSVTAYHLMLSDDDLGDYDSNFKVYPPLRGKAEIRALMEAVEDGTVDCIASHHLPHERDSKDVEFEYAKFGISSIETVYATLKTALPGISENRWVELLSLNPRRIAGLAQPVIQKDARANVTIFQPGGQTRVTESFFRSKSQNSPLIGKNLSGRVIGIINREGLFLN